MLLWRLRCLDGEPVQRASAGSGLKFKKVPRQALREQGRRLEVWQVLDYLAPHIDVIGENAPWAAGKIVLITVSN
jgi:hypothetical protein